MLEWLFKVICIEVYLRHKNISSAKCRKKEKIKKSDIK